jgi:hypothetical protein
MLASPAIHAPRTAALFVGHLIAHAAWISVQRSAIGAALVIPVRRSRSELECSPGVRPRYDCTRCDVGNRPGSSIVATNRSAVTGPMETFFMALLEAFLDTFLAELFGDGHGKFLGAGA